MRTILEIVTFHTPVDIIEITENKEQKIRTMIADFLINSWENFEEKKTTNEDFEIQSYILMNTILDVSIKRDNKMWSYILPHCIIRVSMNDSAFEKTIIEDFLNTIIRFFSGTLVNEYFLDYDSSYHLDEMNQWKKYSIKDITNIDVEWTKKSKSKNLLDSMLYLHYTLEKQIFSLGIQRKELETFLSGKWVSEYPIGYLSLSKKRTNTIIDSLLNSITVLHNQIQIILSYFTQPL